MKPDKTKSSSSRKKQGGKQYGPAGRVFDVSRPGRTPAAPYSKPVIVGHKSSAQQAQTTVSGIGQDRPLLTKRKIDIKPGGDIEVKSERQPAAETTPPKDKAGFAGQPSLKDEEALGTAALDASGNPPEVSPGAPAKEAESPQSEESAKEQPQPEPEPAEEKPASTPETEAGPQPDSSTEVKETKEPGETETPQPAPQDAETGEPKDAGPELIDEELAKELPQDFSSVSKTSGDQLAPSEDGQAQAGAQAEKTYPAPEPKIEPLFDSSGHIVVSQHKHHRRHGVKLALMLLLILALAAAALNIALDLELLNLEGLPHTDLL